MIYDLPTSVEVHGTVYEIRSDYRSILDICMALEDPELGSQEKSFVLLDIFYSDFADMPEEHYQEAVQKCIWFINCGEEGEARKSPKLVDWGQDFRLIVAPVNRILGTEARAVQYLHWWSFISAYYEIGECLFAQVIRIREKKAKGKPLDKSDREFYRKNRSMVDLKVTYTAEEENVLKAWTGGN